jgi:glutamyl-tRNA(Gln) amidotransferase subunit E
MKKKFDPKANYQKTRKLVGYVPRKEATQKTYDNIGFMSGLEVHQQLLTREKLFCRCPAGRFNDNSLFDAEVIRHMRPTLSELGEYDGTALMEFKTRKTIIYRIKNETTCTYEVDDTPPFPVNREALDIAIEISLLSKLNIVGEVHITRKQYLDGSIPTGFQRTAIIGVEGEIPLRNKKIRLIQLSLEEDSCREISDIGHVRTYKTDRLGMPLIETVTYPDMVNPDEVKEACDYIRFASRSTGKVRTGIGAGRQDVNVSCRGGVRVEIKGVAHTRWIPELTHNECFRQWALLKIRDELVKRINDTTAWNIKQCPLHFHSFKFKYPPIVSAKGKKHKLIAVNLPDFKGLMSFFTQPGKMFADEISDRLKVIACIEKPNMTHSESLENEIAEKDWESIRETLEAGENDAQLVFWGPEDDVATALDVIEERCRMAFVGVPNETRKSFENGTTIFERVLPGADRMYPDTDSPPIPLEDSHIDFLSKNLPEETYERFKQLLDWKVPEDTYTYIMRNNLYPEIEQIVNGLGIKASFVGTFFGHRMKFVEGHYERGNEFTHEQVYDLLEYLKNHKIDLSLAVKMLPVLYEHPKMDFESILTSIKFKKISKEKIVSTIPFLQAKFAEIKFKEDGGAENRWIMGQLHTMAAGNISLQELSQILNTKIN